MAFIKATMWKIAHEAYCKAKGPDDLTVALALRGVELMNALNEMAGNPGGYHLGRGQFYSTAKMPRKAIADFKIAMADKARCDKWDAGLLKYLIQQEMEVLRSKRARR